jgi:tetratricopeptide (TPR) repeat protein
LDRAARSIDRAAVLRAAAVLGLAIALTGAHQVDRWRSVTRLWEPLLHLYPEQASSHQLYGDALLLEGRASDAIIHLERAMELAPKTSDPSGIEALAAACFAVSRYDCALRWYSELFLRFGPSPGVALRLYSASLFESAERPAEAAIARATSFAALRGLGADANGGAARIRRFFDVHLARDSVPKTALAHLRQDPEVGAVSAELLALYRE